jgi:hypothetical protein
MGGKAETIVTANRKTLKKLNHKTSFLNVTLNIKVFWVSSKHTSYKQIRLKNGNAIEKAANPY